MAKFKTFRVCEIANKTWAINGAGMSMMYLAAGEEKALLIDTGVGMVDLKALIPSLTSLPCEVVLTHGHGDHIAGAAQFEEVYIHPADAPMLKNFRIESMAFYINAFGRSGVFDIYDCGTKDIVQTTGLPKVKDLCEGMVFDLGGRKVKVIETPGHTPGGCSFIDERERILFSGDVCYENLLSGWSAIKQLEKGLRNIKAHENEFDRNFCGHMGMADSPFMLSVDKGVLDDAIYLCRGVFDGSIPTQEGQEQQGMKPEVAKYGKVTLSLYY